MSSNPSQDDFEKLFLDKSVRKKPTFDLQKLYDMPDEDLPETKQVIVKDPTTENKKQALRRLLQWAYLNITYDFDEDAARWEYFRLQLESLALFDYDEIKQITRQELNDIRDTIEFLEKASDGLEVFYKRLIELRLEVMKRRLPTADNVVLICDKRSIDKITPQFRKEAIKHAKKQIEDIDKLAVRILWNRYKKENQSA